MGSNTVSETGDLIRSDIRADLSNLSFEELQKLKEELGSKVFNEAMHGKKAKKSSESLKRANKNRPREVSSKIPVKTFDDIIVVKKKIIRDPRFDSLCGTFDEKHFKKNYNFIREIKNKEKEELKLELENETDSKRKHQIKLLIQRIENQEREEQRRKKLEEKQMEEKQKNIELWKEGKKPYFRSKQEQKVAGLIENYNELKQSGKLMKHIEKKRRKNKTTPDFKL